MNWLVTIVAPMFLWLSIQMQTAIFQPPGEHPEPEVIDKAIQEQLAKAAEREASFAKRHPLGMDPKLHPRFTVAGKQPKLQELLQLLAESTRLSFSVAENLKHHDPNLPHLKLKDVPAYRYMEIILAHDLDNGRWEKTDGGYRLEGVSRAQRPSPPSRFSWAAALYGFGAAFVVGAGVILYQRRVKKPAAAKSG